LRPEAIPGLPLFRCPGRQALAIEGRYWHCL
jgi:hypothetical protein